MPEFAFYELFRDHPELVVAMNELEIEFRASGRPVAADMILRAFSNMETELRDFTLRMAVFATETLQRVEAQERVRPDTMGGGGPRLGDYLSAAPLNIALAPGSIGIADEDLLDKNVPWWITNEVGSSARVGGRLFGLFHDGDQEMPPSADAGARREHPLFTPAPLSAGGGPGLIREPIPERRFIMKSVPIIEREWHAGFNAIKARMMSAMDSAMVTYR